ncbi:MAG: cation-transporting P-type ATPase, partial [Spirochaetales bacterium]|nr:cation-transporting P-type ATPase [Spirochaetales bacterium]
MSLEAPNRPWGRTVEEVLAALKVDAGSGLTDADARRRRGRFGPNRLRSTEAASPWGILASQFKSVIMAVLGVAAGLSFVFGQWVDGGAIAVAMAINAAVGFATELKATRSMEALRRLERTSAHVRRGGRRLQLDAEALVPGDIVLLESGDVVGADLRLLESSKLQTNESALTGESVPVAKQVEAVDAEAPLAERACMLFKGTFVTRGSGAGVVVATGMGTEVGTIASLVEEAEEEQDPLRRRLDVLGRRLVWLVLAIAALAAGAGLVSGKALFLMIETAVALLVAAIPEGLAVVETVALARGMRRMARRRALVRRLPAVQTLGSTTVIFTDKTGTLTENRMTVRKVGLADGEVEVTGEGISPEGDFRRDGRKLEPEGEPGLRRLLRVGVLCNNAALGEREGSGEDPGGSPVGDPGGSPVGDPLEVALLVAGAKAGLRRSDLLESQPEAREVAFDPEVKMMATYHRRDGQLLVAVKGAPDAVLERCTRVREGEGVKDLDEEGRRRWRERNEELAAEGFRMLALAEREAQSADEQDPYRDLTLLGLAAMLDPPRQEVREAVDTCQAAGIRVVMVTGDQAATARAVGLAVGLIDREDEPQVEGRELEGLEELSEEER